MNRHNIHNINILNAKREGFQKGKRAGIWLSYNYIFPISIDRLNKDMARTAVSLLKTSTNIGRMSYEQLKQSLRDAGYEKIAFKEDNGILTAIPK